MSREQNQNEYIEKFTHNVKDYLKENDELLKKHKLVVRLVINFALKRKTPLLSRIALWVVGRQGGQLDMQFGDTKK